MVEDLLLSPLHVKLVVCSSSLGDSERGQALVDAAEDQSVPVHEVSEDELSEYAATDSPQGVLAMAEIPSYRFSDLLPSEDPAAVLLLDAVQDPGNFGTLLRTAEALGATGVVALPGTVDPWNPKSVRAAMGASFRLPVVASSWPDAADWLLDARFTILAAAAGGAPLPHPAPTRTALVLGNEGAGVSAETLARATRSVGIPIRGRAESLNVAAAGAILLYELLRQ